MAEVLVATALVTVGLLALITGFQYATSGVATGGGETAAVFLAEQRIEQLRAEAMRDFSAPGLAAGTMTDYCVAGHVGGGASVCQPTGLAGSPYTRSTTITNLTAVTGCPTTPVSCKQIEVRVSYRPVTSAGTLDQSRTVELVTVLGPRA
jgi:Tfp pilus assembly protein PilV